MLSLTSVKTHAVSLSIAGAIALSSVLGPSMASADSSNRVSGSPVGTVGIIVPDIIIDPGYLPLERKAIIDPGFRPRAAKMIVDPIYSEAIIDPIYSEAIIDPAYLPVVHMMARVMAREE